MRSAIGLMIGVPWGVILCLILRVDGVAAFALGAWVVFISTWFIYSMGERK
jgi:hypothetical protein